MADPYVDSVLGEWKFDPRASKKDAFVWKRKATIKLHKDHAQKWTDPETFETKNVHGEVTLTETKRISKENSAEQRYRGLELTKASVTERILP